MCEHIIENVSKICNFVFCIEMSKNTLDKRPSANGRKSGGDY